MITISLIDSPISIFDAGTYGLTSGSPNLFLQQSEEQMSPENSTCYPTFSSSPETIDSWIHNIYYPEKAYTVKLAFWIKFPEIKLPEKAELLFVKPMFHFAFDAYEFEYHFRIGDSTKRFVDDLFQRCRSGELSDTPYPRTCVTAKLTSNGFSVAEDNILFSYSQFFRFEFIAQRMHLQLLIENGYGHVYKDIDIEDYIDYEPDYFRFYRLKLERRVEFPYTEDIKLYTKSEGSSNTNGTDFVIPAIKSLLDSVEYGHPYKVIQDGELSSISLGTMLTDETTEFRGKLKTLAIASSTFIRFDSLQNAFLVSSLEEQYRKEAVPIPLDCFVLENNMYSFAMQTPMKDQIYSALEISYGKNIATGKFEHRILVNVHGIEHDGSPSPLPNSKWDNLKMQLIKNSNNGINNLKSIENEWIQDKKGAESAAYNYLSWCCAPLYTAKIKCITQLMLESIDIGSFVWFDLKKYPSRLKQTVWIVTAISEDLDSRVSTISLLETWNAKNVPAESSLLTEDRNHINAEDGQHIKLEE
jgi:hypothetical protein